jgi:hypothetical protein
MGPASEDRQFLAYNTRYHMPPLTDPAHPPKDLISEGPNNNFYSFTHGSVRWIMLVRSSILNTYKRRHPNTYCR